MSGGYRDGVQWAHSARYCVVGKALVNPTLLWPGKCQIPWVSHFFFPLFPGPIDRVWYGGRATVQVDCTTFCDWVVWCGHQLQRRKRSWRGIQVSLTQNDGWWKDEGASKSNSFWQNILTLRCLFVGRSINHWGKNWKYLKKYWMNCYEIL